MSKNLTMIQKCARVFRVFVRVGMILSIAGSVFGLAATVLWVRWNNAPAGGVTQLDQLMQLVQQGDYYQKLAALIADTIACAFGAVLLSFALSYLTRELSDGTPFVDDTALQLRRLGVLTIVLPIVSVVLQMIPYAVFDLSAPDRLDNAGSVILGVVLILASLVFRYGAELAQSKEMN